MLIADNTENLNNSTPLNTTQNWQNLEDTLSFDNASDYYSFQLNNRSSFDVVLNDLSDNAGLRLWNENGFEITNSSVEGTSTEIISRVLDAGTYFIEVYQVDDGEISYGLEYKSIPQEFQFNTEAIKGGVKLTDTQVFDGNGGDDIQKVDFWLKKPGESWKKIGQVSEFSSNNDGSVGFYYDITNLEDGEYYIWGEATDKYGAKIDDWGESFSVKNNLAPILLSFTTEQINGGIQLNNTNVYDANGIEDLERIDFQLKQDDGEWIDIEDAVDFSPNQDGSIGFNYSIEDLEIGKYELRATAYDKDDNSSETLKTYFQINNLAPEDLRFEVEVVGSEVRLTDSTVSDINGIDDLSRVDFWLRKENESWQNIDDVVDFYTRDNGSTGFDYSIQDLEKGNYILWGITWDDENNYSNNWQQSFAINNTAPTLLDFDFQQIDRGIELTNTKIIDEDGLYDLQRVDFQLKKEGGEWIDIDEVVNFSQNQDGSIGFYYSINGLEPGDYQLKAVAYDKAGESTEALTTYFTVNNSTPSDFNFDIEIIENSVRVVNTKVYDADGIDDLVRVDFWLKKDDRAWENISDADEFSSNQDGSFSFDYSLDSLEAGDYVLWARTRDRADSYSNVSQESFTIFDTSEPEKDWFDQNIQDESIRTLTRSSFSDSILDRQEMITILKHTTTDDSIVDETEINDLRTIIENGFDLGMADYVRVLSDKVINGDLANQDNGNLQAGSNADHLDKLINKWFYGGDRPETFYTYREAEGSLFQNGISLSDINQGFINNCFFLAGLGATFVQSPEIVENMFIDNGDGTFTVRFYNQGVADYVTVDRFLPTDDNGNFVYANPGDNHGNPANELWVALAEKAYAQLNESGWINQDGTNSYNGIGNAGYLSDAFAHITGKQSVLGILISNPQLNGQADYQVKEDVINAFESGEVIGFGSKSSGIASNIVESHAYALVDYDEITGKFTLFNPWETNNTGLKHRTLELTWEEINSNFSYLDSTIS